MVIRSKKSKDPMEVGLSAVREAPNIRDADAKVPPGGPGSAMSDTHGVANINTMHVATLRSVAGSTIVAIPKVLLESLGLAPPMTVGLSIDHGRLVIEPRPRPRYSLAELLAKCDPSAPASDEDKQWDAAEPIGREVF